MVEVEVKKRSEYAAMSVIDRLRAMADAMEAADSLSGAIEHRIAADEAMGLDGEEQATRAYILHADLRDACKSIVRIMGTIDFDELSTDYMNAMNDEEGYLDYLVEYMERRGY